MGSLMPSQLSLSSRSLQLQRFELSTSASLTSRVLAVKHWECGKGNYGLPNISSVFRFLCTNEASVSPANPKRWFSSGVFHSVAPSFALDQDIGQSGLLSVGKASDAEMGSSQVDTAVRLLHRAARSFSSSIKRCVMTRSSPELANAWVGVDVHAWQRHIAYQAAVYALLMTVIEARFTSCDEERNDPSKVHIVLSPKLNLLLDSIETQLNTRNPKLVTWFKMVKLPNLARYFIPLFKKWSSEYGRSGIAEVIHSICFCVAVDKLAERVSCPRFTLSIPEIMGELMDLSYNLVSMDRLHSLASEAGVEQEFLAYFGSKVLPNKESREVAFWIGLVHKRLCVAFRRESFISSREGFSNRKNLERDLATLGLFAFLGRRTRLFLLGMGMKDLDEQLNNFISYLECGSLFIYAELSSLPVYQLFMEIVAEEMEWLDFYAAIPGISLNERKRSKQHPIQAEKEIILSAVYCVCSDVFSGFSHFSSSTQQSLDENVVTFLLRSKNLLTMCLEDYLAAYYRSGERMRIAERFVNQPIVPSGNQHTINRYIFPGLRTPELMMTGIQDVWPQYVSGSSKETDSCMGARTITCVEVACSNEAKPLCESLAKIYRIKLIATSCNILMGTRLLFIDISVALPLLLKQIRRNKLTERERKKLRRTLVDFASVIPIAILMLLPLSVVGHAAILAAIKKYIPALIPSPYSPERLDIVKQLNRTKKMELQL